MVLFHDIWLPITEKAGTTIVVLWMGIKEVKEVTMKI